LATQAETATRPAQSPYERIGGIAVLRAITDRFYDLMEQDPAYKELRAMHAPDLAPMRASLPSFLAGWAGGPRDWWEANPGKCMMSMHKPFPIDRQTATQWAEAMRRAIADVAPADTEIANALADVLAQMATGMARD
jgi:hemoglobin